MSESDWHVVSEAIIEWSGYRNFPTPNRDELRLADKYGAEVVSQVLSIRDEFYLSSARDKAATESEMSRLVKEDFARMHDQISEEAIGALAWCYVWDYR